MDMQYDSDRGNSKEEALLVASNEPYDNYDLKSQPEQQSRCWDRMDKYPGGMDGLVCAGLGSVLLLLVIVAQANGNNTCTPDNRNDGSCTDNPLLEDNQSITAVIFMILALIFISSESEFYIFKKFYEYIPALFLCYLVPGLWSSAGVYVGADNQLYSFASSYLLAPILVWLCLACDIKGIIMMGWRPIAMFFVGTSGVVFGAPLAVLIVGRMLENVVEPGETYKGLACVAGSWIGGGANFSAMESLFDPSASDKALAVAVDVVCANVWLGVLFLMIGKREKVNEFMQADSSPVDDLIRRVEYLEKTQSRNPTKFDLMMIVATGFICGGVAHFLGVHIANAFDSLDSPAIERLSFDNLTFWRLTISTAMGLLLSFSPLRKLEFVGASKIASVALYFLVAGIGMQMDITSIADRPGIFLLGFIWIFFHGFLMIAVTYLLKAPLFFMAVASQANIGGAASAPVVAAAFHPSLAPVGAMFGVFGYVVGTIAAWASALMMQEASELARWNKG